MKKIIRNTIFLSMLGFLSSQDCADDPTGAFDAMGGCETILGWGTPCDGTFAGYIVGEICPVSCGTCSTGPSGCDLPDMSLSVLADGSVLYNTSEAIGGFQFIVDGATLNGSSAASGGDAGAESFSMSTNPGNGMVLGFSLTGATIGPACGTLLELDIDGVPTGLSDLIISDANANPLPFSNYSDSAVSGCMDESACNYNPDATEDDGSCTYAEGSCDCDGNPPDGACDCNGNVEDCAGECGGDAVEDCAGECGGDSVVDECGECGGDGIADGACDCDGNVVDCAGDCGGSAVEDECGVCGGDGTSCIINIDFSLGDAANGGLDVFMSNTHPLAGFQFEVSGISLSGDLGSGGSAEDYGFVVNTSDGGSLVLGFSFDGTTIPAGTGLGSSSSFAVGLMQALYALKGQSVTKYTLAESLISQY